MIRTLTAIACLLISVAQASIAAVKWPVGQLLPSLSRPASTMDLIPSSWSGADPSVNNANAVLFSSLMGIVNSKQPRIFAGDTVNPAANTWLKTLGLGGSVPSSPWALIIKYRREINGLVVYDDTQPDTLNLATAIAGAKHALVASPLLLSQLTAAPYNLPILVDLRGQFTSKLAVYQYLYDNYWPRLPHRILMGLNPTAVYGSVREYATAVNSAVVWLDPNIPAENALLGRFLASMGPGTCFLGWWPEEGSGVHAASVYGVATNASDWCTDLSVYSGTSRKVAVKDVPPMPATVQNKIYLTFIMSDGDNLQYDEHLLRSLWDDPNRGKVPMGWTMSPVMLDAMPGLLNYYYTTATANDCLLSGPSGYGYTYPNDWTDAAALKKFIAKSNDYCRRAGFRIITVWNTINGGINPDVGAAYAANAPSLLGLTAENAGGPLTIYGNSLPGFPLTATYCGVEDQLTKEIAGGSAGWDGASPRFLLVQAEPWHGMTPTHLLHVVSQLNSNYVLIRPDTMFQMIRSLHGLPINPNNSSSLAAKP
jgi:hypothetical protein